MIILCLTIITPNNNLKCPTHKEFLVIRK